MQSNGNLDRLLGEINERTKHLVKEVDEIKTDVKALELHKAEQGGGKKMLALMLASAGTLGGIVATFMDKFWAH